MKAYQMSVNQLVNTQPYQERFSSMISCYTTKGALILLQKTNSCHI